MLAALSGCPGTVPSGDGASSAAVGRKDPEPSPPVFNVFSLRVARHEDQPFSERNVDEVFFEASRLLQTLQTDCPDVATNVTFLRDGPVEVFTAGESVITTENQLDALFDAPQDITIVHALVGVCGIRLPASVATILGCATTRGSMVIVAEAPPDVWAHEWGHVQGLGHRDDCPSNLMHAFEIETHAVNPTESRAFLTPTPSGKLLREPTSEARVELVDHLLREADEPLEGWLERIVGRPYLAGLPVRLALECDAAAVGRLMARCQDVALAPGRTNVNRLLGLSADGRACHLLIEQVLEAAGELDGERFRAVAEAFLALGRLLAHDPSGTALTFLVTGTDPSSWADQDVQWRFGPYAGPRLHQLLARLSILALGVSGTEAAREYLELLQEQIEAGVLDAGPFADQVDEALLRVRGREAELRARLSVERMP